MSTVADLHVAYNGLEQDPQWGPLLPRATDLVVGQLAEFARGKAIEWRRAPGLPPAVELTIREGEFAGSARLTLDEARKDYKIDSRASIAWGQLNLAQMKHAFRRIQQILTDMIPLAEAADAAGVAGG